MSITREQVADLRKQDVVRLTNRVIPGLSVEGKLFEVQGVLQLCSWMPVRRIDGEPALNWLGWDLTVVSRAPRPLYVNHPRTEPVPGDVVRDADSDDPGTWTRARLDFGAPWYPSRSRKSAMARDELPKRLRLLVDGEIGQVVP